MKGEIYRTDFFSDRLPRDPRSRRILRIFLVIAQGHVNPQYAQNWRHFAILKYFLYLNILLYIEFI